MSDFNRDSDKILVTPDELPASTATAAGGLATIPETKSTDEARRIHPIFYGRNRNKSVSTKSRNGTLPRASADGVPPPYTKEWRPEDEEGIGRLRGFRSRRGGLGRVILVGLIVLALLLALAIGLGVGLSQRHKRNSSSATSSAQSSQASLTQSFPLGEYSFVTTLRTVSTNCSSNAATWRCYPYSTYQSDNSTSGLALFNWILNSTTTSFASNSTPPTTAAAGISAGISVSSSSDPFSISLSNQALTFINDNNNPRYTFSFTHSKVVVPTAAITLDNSASICYFNQTVFSATLYLSNSQTTTYPGASLAGTAQVSGGYTPWPYAVDISEVADGGQNAPACYETVNGAVGQSISGLAAQNVDSQCACDYANFG